jgi:hypothetical protein
VRVPSPKDDQQEEQEIFEEREAPHSWEAYQPGGGSTAPLGRSNRAWQREKKHSSPLHKLINIFLGMCKTQRDIEVAQLVERKKDKKMRDTMEALHTQAEI